MNLFDLEGQAARRRLEVRQPILTNDDLEKIRAIGEISDNQFQTKLFDIYTETLRQVPLWPSFGNHDGASANSAIFAPPPLPKSWCSTPALSTKWLMFSTTPRIGTLSFLHIETDL